ncbi:MAG TPA: hypothetical protein VJG32_16785 [Anaerolineae bacterium]|nr:hypothetical protein [Anaerolineae bacterium]
MQHRNRWMLVILLMVGLQLVACGPSPAKSSKVAPVQIEDIEGSDFKRVVLTAKAAERLDIQTAPVRDEEVNGTPRLVVPYAAVIYGLKGETWAYSNPEPLVFVRQLLNVEYIEGDLAVLLEGPAVGTAVVTVGGAELYGAETGVSK